MHTSERVPVISLFEDPERLHAGIGEALERVGFVIVTDHGIAPNLLDAAYEAAADVFALPIEKKLKYARSDRRSGYAPFRVERAKDGPPPDLQESWSVRATEGGLPVEFPHFGKVCRYVARQLGHLGNQMLDYVGEHLGKPEGFFREWTHGGSNLLRVIRYPEVPAGAEGIRAAAHEDVSLITLLPAPTAPGLQLRTRDGEWVPVVDEPGSIIVNAGDILRTYTQGRIRSATHRVVNMPGVRFSIPYYVQPRADVVLREEPRLTAGEYLEDRIRMSGIAT